MDDLKLKIEYLPLSEITPYKRNAKLHPVEQLLQIERSIQEFGFNDPIAICRGEIVEGHGRYLAAKDLGLDIVPVIRLDGLTDEQRRAYALVHNKLTMNTGFDMEKLVEELNSIITINMNDFGMETLESIASDLDTFFEGADEMTPPAEKNRVEFAIEAGNKRTEIFSYLDSIGVEYEEH